ncbi:MAG: DMT family transporter [Thiolinea sp.]
MTQHNDQTTRGIYLMIIACIILPMMDATSKSMGVTIAAGLIVLARFFFQSLFLWPFVWRKLYWPKGLELRLHLLRAFTLSFATICFFTAIQVMPIADALAIFFVMPLIVTLLAPWILGEIAGWRRLLAVTVGMFGAIIIIQPSHEIFGWRAILPLGTAVNFSFYLMFTRKLARNTDTGEGLSPLAMQFWSGFFGFILTAIAIALLQPLEWQVFTLSWPELWQWWRLVLVGFLAAVGHLIMTAAFKYADASLLAPFQYVELIVAALLGWWLFDDIPSMSTWLGTLILVASGMYIFQRERKLSQEN